MPDLSFQITNVAAVSDGLTPALRFELEIAAANPDDRIQALMLHAQIQIQSPQREYTAAEKEKLTDLFGVPERWSQTLRNKFWTSTTATTGSFTAKTRAHLDVPCTFDLNVASAKYFYALEDGEVSLLFLFSGSLFYQTPDGRLQIERISWNKECVYSMRIQTWREMLGRLYPNCAWLSLRHDVFERLYALKRKKGIATWEQVIEQLLDKSEDEQAVENGQKAESHVEQISSTMAFQIIPHAEVVPKGSVLV